MFQMSCDFTSYIFELFEGFMFQNSQFLSHNFI